MSGGRRLLFGLLFLAALLALRRWSPDLSDLEALRVRIEGAGLLGPLIYIALYLLSSLLLLPGLPLTIAAGILFGPIWGTIWASAGSTAGAAGAFLAARAIGGGAIEGWLAGRVGALTQIREEVLKRGWAYVAVLRMIPIVPYNLLNYALGLTEIPFLHYLAGTWVGMLPWTAAYVLLSFSLVDFVRGGPGWIVAGVALALSLLLLIRQAKKKAPGKDLPGPPEISGLL